MHPNQDLETPHILIQQRRAAKLNEGVSGTTWERITSCGTRLALAFHIYFWFTCGRKIPKDLFGVCLLHNMRAVGFAFLTFVEGGGDKEMTLDNKAHSGSENYPLVTFDKKTGEEGVLVVIF